MENALSFVFHLKVISETSGIKYTSDGIVLFLIVKGWIHIASIPKHIEVPDLCTITSEHRGSYFGLQEEINTVASKGPTHSY